MTDSVPLTTLQQHGLSGETPFTPSSTARDIDSASTLGHHSARVAPDKPSVIERFVEALASAITKLRSNSATPGSNPSPAIDESARDLVQNQLRERQIKAAEEPVRLKDVRGIIKALAPPKNAFDAAPSLVHRRTIGKADRAIFDAANIKHHPVLNSNGSQKRTDGIGTLPANDLHLTAQKSQSILQQAQVVADGAKVSETAKLQPLLQQLAVKTAELERLEQSQLLPGANDHQGQKQAADQLHQLVAVTTEIDQIANELKKTSAELLADLTANVPESDAGYRAFEAQWHAVNELQTQLGDIEARSLATQINTVNLIRGVVQGYENNHITVGDALQLTAVGIELDSDSQSTDLSSEDWQFAKSETGRNAEVGRGESGAVLKIVANPGTPSEARAVFKPLQTHQSQAAVLGEFSAFQPIQRPEARNIAVSNIDQTLGLNVAPATAIVKVDGQWGLAMEHVQGDSNDRGVFHDHPDLEVGTFLGNGAALRDLSKLEVLDVLVGQLDRHGGNYLVDIDPQTQQYRGLKGIDHDHCLLPTDTVDVNRLRGRHLPDQQDQKLKAEGWGTSYGFKGVGLPNFIDRQTYNALLAPDAKANVLKSVSGLIEAEALEALAQRWDTLVDHAKTLEGQGRVVDNWHERAEEVIHVQKQELDHSYFAQHSLKRFGSPGELGTVDLEPPLRPPLR